MKTRPIREMKIMKAVTTHGSERLLNGLLARLSFVATGIYFRSRRREDFS
jgi:hypothetical protein